MTIDKFNKDLLIEPASLVLSPVVPVLFCLSAACLPPAEQCQEQNVQYSTQQPDWWPRKLQHEVLKLRTRAC